MDTSHPTEIALSRGKTAWLLLGGLAFVALGLWLLTSASEFSGTSLLRNPTSIRIVGAFSVAFFGFIAVYAARRLANPTPGLLLDARGVTDNTGAVSAGFVPWSDVVDVTTGGLAGQRFLYLMLRDPAAFLQSVSPLKRTLMAQNGKLGPSPVALTSVSLTADFDEMTALVRAYWQAHGRG